MGSLRTIARCLILRTRGSKGLPRLRPGAFRMHVLFALVPFCVHLVRVTHWTLEPTNSTHECVMRRIPFVMERR
jgi:hypothetical protein